MLRCELIKKINFVLITIFLLPSLVMAQLKADFSADRLGGCAPLLVSFTNTTTGASISAEYFWEFGNGNTSSLENVGAMFAMEKDYIVTLTVKDGQQTSIKSQTVTIYKKPVVDFNFSPAKGCAPYPVTFTSKSLAGSGSISNYFWDFGDGSTEQTYSNNISHTYFHPGKNTVILTVTNNEGCSDSKTIPEVTDILPGVKASFEANKTFLCQVSDGVTMINNSTGTGTLTYNWNFGDGYNTTSVNPVHIFNKQGAFAVQLAVKSSLGCTDTLVKPGYLNIANFKSQISVPEIVCRDADIEIRNNSVPQPTSFAWTIDGSIPLVPDSYGNYKYRFSTNGLHSIQLTNQFGDCRETTTKTFDVKGLPQPAGYIVDVPTYCFPPVTVNFKDTTAGAVDWGWNFQKYTYPLSIQGKGQSASYRFTWPGDYGVTMFVTDASGCTSTIEKHVIIEEPTVILNTTDNNGFYGCDSLTKKFKFETDETLTSFTWVFGDGSTSTEAMPEHTFGPGLFGITLKYTTNKGCSGTAILYTNVQVYTRPKIDFYSKSGTTICGNTMTFFERIAEDYLMNDYWMINGVYGGSSWYNQMQYQFADTGKYTVSLIVYNNGCKDTITKVDYITVLPSFPKISEAKNTCDGDRLTVTFKQTSRYAKQWTWNFGDGTMASFDTDVAVIKHHYNASGAYKVVLTTTNGVCSVSDSLIVYVMVKQHPILTSEKTAVCLDEGLHYSLTNLDRNPYDGVWVYHYVYGYEYNDGTSYFLGRSRWDDYANWIDFQSIPFSNNFKNLERGKDSIRVITEEVYFNCLDTSNYIPIKVTGAIAGFETLNNNVCFRSAIQFKDTSKSLNSPIKTLLWNFGDGSSQVSPPGVQFAHMYQDPGVYNVTLKATDSSGCASTFSSVVDMVMVTGPKAAFSASGASVALNTNVQFYNNTNNYGSAGTNYEWNFGDGSTSTAFSPSHTYTIAGKYRVSLVASNAIGGCTDSAFMYITVNDFNAAFTYSSSYLTSSGCLPLLARFHNTSLNYTMVKWDFGDGNGAEDTNDPSHVYTQPGVYIITLQVTGQNGLTGTFIDSIIVKQPGAIINADILHSCKGQSITFNNSAPAPDAYWWDFGDGVVKAVADTFVKHYYGVSGVYSPSMMVKDTWGCSTVVGLGDKIVIDSLYIALNNLPASICSPKDVSFLPTINSVAADGVQQKLSYHWDFGTGNSSDTSVLQMPTFHYAAAGTYPVQLKVVSPYGCIKQVGGIITAYEGLGGQINGPAEVCEGESVQLLGSTKLPGQPQWKWIFHDGTTIQDQNPPVRKYQVPGSYPVMLVVDNVGCKDTIIKTIAVYENPAILLSTYKADLCAGSSLNLVAEGASSYTWSPGISLSNTNAASVIASPAFDITYKVTGISNHGCINSDSVQISVIHPFRVKLVEDTSVCAGNSIQLKATGAASYLWIGNTVGLNDITSANPMAAPSTSISYSVVGYDAMACFTDTAHTWIMVNARPFVHAGPDAEILAGSSYTIQTTGSNDILNWVWSPDTYLSCSTCPSPEARPVQPVNYTVMVTNAQGCTASDTVSLKLLCKESAVLERMTSSG
jgi:PKD repeat protein